MSISTRYEAVSADSLKELNNLVSGMRTLGNWIVLVALPYTPSQPPLAN